MASSSLACAAKRLGPADGEKKSFIILRLISLSAYLATSHFQRQALWGLRGQLHVQSAALVQSHSSGIFLVEKMLLFLDSNQLRFFLLRQKKFFDFCSMWLLQIMCAFHHASWTLTTRQFASAIQKEPRHSIIFLLMPWSHICPFLWLLRFFFSSLNWMKNLQ